MPPELAMTDNKRRGLGRGLSALLGDAPADKAAAVDATAATSKPTQVAAIGDLRPSAFQPRRNFEESEIDSLASSVSEMGILQPILVRRKEGGGTPFEIVAGERRWRAAQKARLHEVPVVVRELDDDAVLEIAIVENVQRADLSILEESEGYQRLIDEFGHTQEQLAKIIGKSRSHIANTLRLLALAPEIKSMLDDGRLSAGHGRALLGASNPLKLARRVVRRGLNVRQVEKLVQDEGKTKSGGGKSREKPYKDANIRAYEADLSEVLGLKVELDYRGDGGGVLRISYQTVEQLEDVAERLRKDGHKLDYPGIG